MSLYSFAFTTGADLLLKTSSTGVKLWALGPTPAGHSWVHDTVPAADGTTPAALAGALWKLPVESIAIAGDMPVVAVVLHPSDFSSADRADEDTRRTVHLFDGITGTHMAELYFRGAMIRALLANADVLAVVMEDGVHLVDLLTLVHIRYEPTTHPLNPLAVAALSRTPQPARPPAGRGGPTYCVAYPRDMSPSSIAPFPHGVRLLSVTFSVASEGRQAATASEGHVSFDRHDVPLHARPVGCVSLNLDGTLCATASVEGSTVKIVNTRSRVILHTLQRSTVRGAVYALAFSFSSAMVAALSHTGTLHVFRLSARRRVDRVSASQTTTAASVAGRPRAFEKKMVTAVAVQGDPDLARENTRQRGLCPSSLFCQYGLVFSIDDQHIWLVQTRSADGSHEVGVLKRFSLFDQRADHVEMITLTSSSDTAQPL